MFKIPLSLITIFHPERFLNMQFRELEDLPSLKKDRKKIESQKLKIAKKKGISLDTENIHLRQILEQGKKHDWFRRTWLHGSDIIDVLSDYSIRLIDTLETGSAPRWKLEARPNWGKEPNILPDYLVIKMKEAFSMSQIGVRQIWINPFAFPPDENLLSAYYEIDSTANLMLGPFDKEDCLREAKIQFRKHEGVVPMREHQTIYNASLTADEIDILPECSFWWAEY